MRDNMKEMLIETLMTRGARSVSPDVLLADVLPKMVEKVKGANFLHCKSPYQTITISAGVSSFSEDYGSTSWKEMVKKADVRLYKAKEGGRDRAVSED